MFYYRRSIPFPMIGYKHWVSNRLVMEQFLEAQRHHIEIWLLNPQVYLLVAALLLFSRAIPAVSRGERQGASVATDYFYGVVYSLLLFPTFAVFFSFLDAVLDRWLPWLNLGLAEVLPIWLQIVIAIVIDDFLQYISHYCRHKFRFLWHFHALHHSQENLNPLTTKRTHPVERVFSWLFIRWIPLAIIGSPPEIWALFITVDAIWDYFIHSNLRVNLGPLGRILVSPQYHRIHHSCLPEHADRNFSDRLVIWDILFGTACLEQTEYPPSGLQRPHDFPHETSPGPGSVVPTVLAQYWYPFRMNYRDAMAWFSKLRPAREDS